MRQNAILLYIRQLLRRLQVSNRDKDCQPAEKFSCSVKDYNSSPHARRDVGVAGSGEPPVNKREASSSRARLLGF